MRTNTYNAGVAGLALLLILLIGSPLALASLSSEQHFNVLRIGTHTYTNVTVTTRNKSYVFLLHSRGMLNVKVAELSAEEKELLGYEVKKPSTNGPITWAKAALKKKEPAAPTPAEGQKAVPAPPPPGGREMLATLVSKPNLDGFASAGSTLLIAGVLLLAGFLFISYCSHLICKKAGTEPGALVWIPILQMFPLLRAARMSPVWFLAGLLPLINVLAHLVWCVKIAQARGKSFWTAIFLILPGTNLLAFLYLAFSDGTEPKEETRSDHLVLGAA